MAGHNNWPYIINLGNSIIGVAVLAMPFCFKQCGILLGMLVLMFCTWLTIKSCQLLMRAGINSRRRSYEFLAYHTHGATGKLLSELGMIGMQVGTLIAQIVVIGDLGPAIFSKFLGIQNTPGLRTFLIMALCLGVGLPLGLLKDLRAVSRASTVCITFYCIFILYVIGLSMPNIKSGEWYHKVAFWRPEGFFQCLPILSFSFGCQTQLFLLYDALPDPSLKAINGVISSAVNLCAVAYLLVGFFGYVAFHTMEVPGDVIGVFPNTFIADVMKICFVFSIVITFPVIIFPCRSSIYTLLFAKLHVEDIEDHDQKSKAHEDVLDADGYLPERLFKGITIFIVVSCMILGILIPNVEFVLGINGAIMGTLICYIFPAMFFLKVMGSKQDSRGMAQLVFILGVTILMLSTYATIISQGSGSHHADVPNPDELVNVGVLPKGMADDLHRGGGILNNQDSVLDKDAGQIARPLATHPPKLDKGEEGGDGVRNDARQEPPNPDPPDVNLAVDAPKKEKSAGKDLESAKQQALDREPGQVKEHDVEKRGDEEAVKDVKHVEDIAKAADANKAKELELQEKEKKQDELLHQLEKHREEQEKLLEEQRQLLKEFKDHHDKDLKKEHEEEKEKAEIPQQQGVGEPAGPQVGQLQNEQPVRGQIQQDSVILQAAQGQGHAQQDNAVLQGRQDQAQQDRGILQPAQGQPQQDGGAVQPRQQAQPQANVQFNPQQQQLHEHRQPQPGEQQHRVPAAGDNLNLPVVPVRGENHAGRIASELHSGVKRKKQNSLDQQAGLEGEKVLQPRQDELVRQHLQQQQQQQPPQGNVAGGQISADQGKNFVQQPQDARAQNQERGHQQQQQQQLLKDSHNLPKHHQPDVPIGGAARHDEQLDLAPRVKRSIEHSDVDPDVKAGIGRAGDDDIARKAVENVDVHMPADDDDASVVKMNVESVAENEGLVKDEGLSKMGKPLENANDLSETDPEVKEHHTENKEPRNIEGKKRNEEMRRKLKSLDVDQKPEVLQGESMQSLINAVQGEVGRHLLSGKTRD